MKLTLILLIMISGCTWHAANIYEYEQGQLIKHTGVGQVRILMFDTKKGLHVKAGEIEVGLVESESSPDVETGTFLAELFKMWKI